MASKTYKKKPDLNSKAGKYFIAKQTATTKEEAKAIAGYSPKTVTTRIEETKEYQAIEEKHYKEVLKDKITLDEIADIQIRNLKQERDIGGSNKASELLLEGKGEKETPKEGEKESVVIVFKKNELTINPPQTNAHESL